MKRTSGGQKKLTLTTAYGVGVGRTVNFKKAMKANSLGKSSKYNKNGTQVYRCGRDFLQQQEDQKKQSMLEYLAQRDLYLTRLRYGERPHELAGLAKKIRSKRQGLLNRGVDLPDDDFEV